MEVPFGTGSGHEIPNIQALMGPSHNGNIVVLFYANGQEPVYAQIVFQGELVAGSTAFGGDLDAAIPLIPSVTNGPPVSILNVESTIGPSHLIYYKHVHGRKVALPPARRVGAAEMPARGLPVLGELQLLGRHEHRGEERRVLPAAAIKTPRQRHGARLVTSDGVAVEVLFTIGQCVAASS